VDLATTDAIDALGVRGSQAVTVTPYVNDPLVRVLQPSAVRVIILTEKIAR